MSDYELLLWAQLVLKAILNNIFIVAVRGQVATLVLLDYNKAFDTWTL